MHGRCVQLWADTLLPVGGYWALGDRGYSPFQGGTNVFSFNDSLDLIRGKHDLKVGLAIRANQMNTGTEAFQDGSRIPGVAGNFSGVTMGGVSIEGNPQADVLMGLLGLSYHDQTFNGQVIGRRWKTYRPFIQDDWRITRDHSQSGAGVGYHHLITEADGRLANFDPTTGQLLIAGQNGVNASAGVKMNWTAFEAAHRRGLEGAWQRQDRRARGLCRLSRFGLEHGRAGLLAESTVFRRGRFLWGCWLRHCDLVLRHGTREWAAPLVLPTFFRFLLPRRTFLRLPERFSSNRPTSSLVWLSSSTRTWSASYLGTLCLPLAMRVLTAATSGGRE